jgi:heme/copper-type cytochrome/quinol oxidase subunit 2
MERREKMANIVQLPADLGYGLPWLTNVLITLIAVASALFLYVFLSTSRSEHKLLHGQDSLKYKLHKYHVERYWAIFVAAALAWLWILGRQFLPTAAFQTTAQQSHGQVHVVEITAQQWAWQLKDAGMVYDNDTGEKGNRGNGGGDAGGAMMMTKAPSSSTSQPAAAGTQSGSSSGSSGEAAGIVKIKAGETVKFIARSLDVNHGFSVLQSSKQMDSPLFQMQVVPGYDNVFYYTFKQPGQYTIRCLEYCGWNHPFMVSQVTIEAAA